MLEYIYVRTWGQLEREKERVGLIRCSACTSMRVCHREGGREGGTGGHTVSKGVKKNCRAQQI